jgi:hypothetical protein
MSHDILKRMGLDHLDVSSRDFLDALNRMQVEARDSLRRAEPLNDPQFVESDLDGLFAGFDLLQPP